MNFDTKSNAPKAILLAVAILVLPAPVFAYVGPGAGLSIIGSLLAFFAAIIVGIFGFLWFPIRRMLRKRRQAALENSAGPDSDTEAVAGETAGSQKRERAESEA